VGEIGGSGWDMGEGARQLRGGVGRERYDLLIHP
jgi:hypothetical protein